jgi:hypothetical protein
MKRTRPHPRRPSPAAFGLLLFLMAIWFGAPLTTFAPAAHGLQTAETHGPFLYGMYEDANLVGGPAGFTAMVHDLQQRDITTVLFANNVISRDLALMPVADRLGFGVIFAPQQVLKDAWFPTTIPADPDLAAGIIDPFVDQLRTHPSLVGYNILDDAPNTLADKTAIAVQQFRARDPAHPALPVIIPGNEQVLAAAQPDVILTYIYPILAGHTPCDLFADDQSDQDAVVSWLRHLSQLNERGVPIWVILQGHGVVKGSNLFSLQPRQLQQPIPEEIREQYWLAVGEGVNGIFWFVYSTQQFWTGLRDNPSLLAEVTDLGARTRHIADVLAIVHKTDDAFSVAAVAPLDQPLGQHQQPYVSTLTSDDGTMYALVVNHACTPQSVILTSAPDAGKLHDVETGDTFAVGSPIPLRGGDGRLLELVTQPNPLPPADAMRL